MRLWAAALLVASVAHADLDEAMQERRVFRAVLVGGLHDQGTRVTWVLFQGRETARLEVFCQQGKRVSKGIRLQGAELDEAGWLVPVSVRYTGKKVMGGYELRADALPAGEGTPCHAAPETLRLRCKLAKVNVRPAGAKLSPGPRQRGEEVVAGVWKPATKQTLRALRCRRPEGALPFPFEEDWPLVFAPPTETAAGVEWAFENSDMVVQEGAYRWLAYP